MSKERVLFALVVFSCAGFAAQGCLSSASNNADGGGGSGSSSGSGSNSGSGAPSGGSEGGACSPVDPTTIIDDMSGANGTANATGGYWYTYSDRTIPNSEPPILLTPASGPPPGTITPPEGQSFPVTDADTISGCMWGFRECTGGGEATWGAGFGMDFNSVPPDGGSVPFNSCDAGQIFDVNAADSGTVGIVLPYDASQWSGVQFWGMSFTGSSQAVYVQMDDDQTSPWGGKCNACNSTGGTVNPCSDSFRTSTPLTFTSSWQQFKVGFADMTFKPQNWSKNNVMGTIHKDKLYNLHFQITKAPAPHFDLGVAMVGFYK